MPRLQSNRLVLGHAPPLSHDPRSHGRANLFNDLLIHLGGDPTHD